MGAGVNPDPDAVRIYGREVHIEPLEPGEVVEDIVVVARTRGPAGKSHTFTAADTQDGEPRRIDPDLQYLIDLGLDITAAKERAGHRPD